jgi:hypothetical protein
LLGKQHVAVNIIEIFSVWLLAEAYEIQVSMHELDIGTVAGLFEVHANGNECSGIVVECVACTDVGLIGVGELNHPKIGSHMSHVVEIDFGIAVL